MSDEQDTPLALVLNFPGGQHYVYDTELPAGWTDASPADVTEYVEYRLADALEAAGVTYSVCLTEQADADVTSALQALRQKQAGVKA
ncbi:hypothetical protein [Streptomyces sp. NBC_01760]|uniref:hypothetical protein n=1 Tax=Streptomyces sp. NBC_01760 TaxID=2975931 RepID=UPI002DDA8CB3|nr:hypothetical protein [Streptomyces sp. NBC_01760]WSC72214.1 hypothetical protein OG807_29110 [Streptomyces sp. NBC_01760]